MGNTFQTLSLESRLEELLSESVEAARKRAGTAFDEEVAPFKGRFVLFGAGSTGRRLLARMRQDGIQPLAFSDSQSTNWGRTVDGLPVLSPKDAVARHGQDAAFIVTIYNNTHYFPETRDRLLKLGAWKVLSVIPVRWKYSEAFLPHYRDDLPHKVLEHRDAIREAFHLWSDEESRREFVAQVGWRLNGDFDRLGTPDPESEYFPQDILRFRPDEVFVDVGAYDGDTVRKFLTVLNGHFRHMIVLEPEPQNYKKLGDYLSTLPTDVSKRIEARPLAASDRPRRLRFTEGEGTSAAISDRGSIEVDCVRLDDLLKGRHPTYIKMDIEGAELEAIEGCRRVIAEDRPMLAVCVYHVQNHLWSVPVCLNRIAPGNSYYLRPHMQECWETVCYAVPPERAPRPGQSRTDLAFT